MKKTLLLLFAMVAGLVANADETTVTIVPNEVTWTAVTDPSAGFTGTKDGVTVTYTQGSSTTKPVEATDIVKFYKSSDLAITAPGTISKIVFTATAANYCVSMEAASGDVTVDTSALTITWTGSTDSFSAKMSTAQVRASKIEVTFESNADYVASPVIEGTDNFSESTTVTITNPNVRGDIVYSLDGTDPTPNGPLFYTEPFTITETTTVKAIVCAGSCSSIATKTFTKAELMSIADIKAGEAGVAVTCNGTVVACGATTLVISDGRELLFVYGTESNAFQVGDVVTVGGTTSLYGGFMQITSPTVTKTDATTVEWPNPVSMDGAAVDEWATDPVQQYAEVSGTLTVSGSYYNFTVSGATNVVSFVVPNKDLIGYFTNNAVLTVRGYFMYYSNSKYCYMVPTEVVVDGIAAPVISGDETFLESTTVTITTPLEDAKIYWGYDKDEVIEMENLYTAPITITKNTTIYAMAVDVQGQQSDIVSKTFTKASIMTVAEALDALNESSSISGAVVKGTVCEVSSIDTSSYGNATYYISDDGTKTNALEVYRGYGLDGAKFTSEDDLAVGDVVTISGDLTVYNSTKEFTTGSKIIEQDKSGRVTDIADISNTLETAYSAREACAVIDDNPYSLAKYKVYVKGIISEIVSESETGGFSNFYISDDGESNGFYVYGCYGFNGENLVAGDIKVGDEVVVYGYLTKYVKDENSDPVYETQKGAQIVQLNGETAKDAWDGYTQTADGTTMASAMSIDDVLYLVDKGNVPTVPVWVKGIIRGNVNTKNGATIVPDEDNEAVATNLSLGIFRGTTTRQQATPGEEDNHISLQLPTGNVRTALNVLDNPDNIGKTVYVYGTVVSSYCGIAGLKPVTNFSWDGVTDMLTGISTIVVEGQNGSNVYYINPFIAVKNGKKVLVK